MQGLVPLPSWPVGGPHHWRRAICACWSHLAGGACFAESGGVFLEGLAFTNAQHFPNLGRRNGPELELGPLEFCPKFERITFHRDHPPFSWKVPSNFRATAGGDFYSFVALYRFHNGRA